MFAIQLLINIKRLCIAAVICFYGNCIFLLTLYDKPWIYEELFDDDSDNTSHDDTHDNDSSYDYDDYEEDY